jgi:hypothetical protein
MAWIPAAIAAAQMVAQMVPGAAESANNAEIKELKSRKRRGELGITDQERDAYWSDTFGVANASIAQQRAQGDATLAATGNTTGANMVAQQQGQMAATAKAAGAAADQIAKLDVQERASEEQELADRLAVKEGKTQQRVNAAVKTASNIGGALGEYDGTTGELGLIDGVAPVNTGGMTATEATTWNSLSELAKVDPDAYKAYLESNPDSAAFVAKYSTQQ